MKSSGWLSKGNIAFRSTDYASAVMSYTLALLDMTPLADVILPNLLKSRHCHREQRKKASKLCVGVCSWDMGHNAAGRAYTLATLYTEFTDVELFGPLFGTRHTEVWEPILGSLIPLQTFTVADEARFVELATEYVVRHPYDLVHLSKPRAPNIILGLLYQSIWGAKIIMDVDDEELSFVNATEPLCVEGYLKLHGALPPLQHLVKKEWTQIAVGLVSTFDGITVANPALQARYGGTVIDHVRDEKVFRPSPERTRCSRLHYGVPLDQKVILFFGTPRAHKGLLETARALSCLGRDDVLFLIVGDFAEPDLQVRLLEVPNVRYQFIGNQPLSAAPDVVSMADLVVLLQDDTSLAAQFQTPAKLIDALAMGVPVVSTPTPALQQWIDAGAVLAARVGQLSSLLDELLDDPCKLKALGYNGRQYFLAHLTISVQQLQLEQLVHSLLTVPPSGCASHSLLLSSIVNAVLPAMSCMAPLHTSSSSQLISGSKP